MHSAEMVGAIIVVSILFLYFLLTYFIPKILDVFCGVHCPNCYKRGFHPINLNGPEYYCLSCGYFVPTREFDRKGEIT